MRDERVVQAEVSGDADGLRQLDEGQDDVRDGEPVLLPEPGEPDEREARKKGKEWGRRLDDRHAEERQRVMLSAAIESYMDG